MIQAGTASQTQTMPVARLSEDQLLRLVLPVPESVVPRIHVGEPVTVNVHSLNRGYEGRVARFSGKIDLATRTMETEIDVPNRGFVLKPGMYAEAALTLDRRADALAVPVQALSVNGQSTAVFYSEQSGDSVGHQGKRSGCRGQPQSTQSGATRRTQSRGPGLFQWSGMMSGFAIRNPYFIVVICLVVLVVGASSLVRMPVDLFPVMNIPVVVVATFYSGMPPVLVRGNETGAGDGAHGRKPQRSFSLGESQRGFMLGTIAGDLGARVQRIRHQLRRFVR